MKTKSYEYNQAIKDLEKYKEIATTTEVKAWLHAELKADKGSPLENDMYWDTEKRLIGKDNQDIWRQKDDNPKMDIVIEFIKHNDDL